MAFDEIMKVLKKFPDFQKYEIPSEMQYTLPDNEILTQQQGLKTQYLCGFADTKNREALHLYIKLTSNGAGFCAEV